MKLLTKIPSNCYIACSGGIDSMVLLDFVLNARDSVKVIHINHVTEHAIAAEDFVYDVCTHRKIPLIIKRIDSNKPKELSYEEHWRNERLKIFNSLDAPVLTAHHLSDAVEWWIFSCLHGLGKLIPVSSGNVLRPLLATSKFDIVSWQERKGVEYITDPSNESRKYMRNVIRHDLMPHALKVNPGLETVIRKKYLL